MPKNALVPEITAGTKSDSRNWKENDGMALQQGHRCSFYVAYGRFNCQDTPKRSSTHAKRRLKP